MAAKPVITADELASLGAGERANDASNAIVTMLDDIESGNISVAQRTSGLTSETYIRNFQAQLERGRFEPEHVLAAFLADDFAGVKRIAGADEAAQQAFVDLVTYLNGHFHGLSETLAENSQEAKAVFEARGFDYSQYPTLEAPDLFAI